MTPTPPQDPRSAGRRWLDFWFAPADPTTLGFMRIITGILMVYIHLSYSFDLQSFFGENGWYGLTDINQERREFPWSELATQWDSDVTPPAFIPEYPHRRKAVVEYYHRLGKLSKDEQAAALAYLNKLQVIDTFLDDREKFGLDKSLPYDPVGLRQGLDFIETIPYDPEKRAKRLRSLIDPSGLSIVDTIPAFVDSMSETDRKKLRDDAENFLKYLPTNSDQRRYVLNHFTEISNMQRRHLLDFFKKYADLDPEAQARRMAYLEKWNNDESRMKTKGTPIFSLWFHITNPTDMALAHAVVIVAMMMFTLGLFTRVVSVVVWLSAVSYIHRTQQILFGMDTMMNLLLVYLTLGPSGKALSLDRWLQCRRAKRNGITPEVAAFLAAPPKLRSAGFIQRMIQIQFCFIYLAAGLSKLKGHTWWNHYAWWDTVANPEFTLIHYPMYEDFLRRMVSSKPVYSFLAAGATLFTLFLEIALPFLVWTKLRPYMVIAGVMFHLGIGVFMGLILFALLMMTLLLSYVPGEAIRKQLFGEPKPTV